MHLIMGISFLIGTIVKINGFIWYQIKCGDAPVKVNQDVNFYSLELEKDGEISFPVKEGRQAYLVQIEGNSNINDVSLVARDGLEIVEEEIQINAIETSHILVIEMQKEA